MTPEEFDTAYFEIAQLLGRSADAGLVRDRLLLLLAMRMPLEDVLSAVGQAEMARSEEALKLADPDAAAVTMAHR